MFSNKQPSPGLQSEARLCYKLLNVELLLDDCDTTRADRQFIETKSHLLILSNASGRSIIIDGRPYVLKPGWLYVCSPRQLMEWTNHIGQQLELLLLHFDVFVQSDRQQESAGTGIEPLFPYIGEAPLQPAMASEASRLFDTISNNWRQGTSSARLRCEAGLLELLCFALAHRERQAELALDLARLELEHHYASEIAIESLARIAGLSRFHFMRLFKERFGKGVAEYRTELRLREAKRLMSEKQLALAEISEKVGYKNESYFSTLFKKQTGLAPAVYQRNRQRKIAAYSWINLGQLLALQMIPVAAPMDHYWTDRYRNKYSYEVTTPLSHHYDFNLQALRQARPEYIVAMHEFIPEKEQDKLRELAPALFLSWEEDWRTHLFQISRFLDCEEEAEIWLKRYERDVRSVRERILPVLGQDQLLVLAVGQNQLSVWGQRAGTVLYDDLGLTLPTALREIQMIKQIEHTELTALHADRILVHVEQGPAAEARWQQLSRSDIWRNLPAVQSGKIHLAIAYSCFDAPWNDYAAEPIGRFLNDVPSLFGI
ncbi:AraC family transcriptional regulator [Paenibacillus glycanilyticus]|uniref:AraC family transcriptional regulator n=1 Tax=Paenibacillus glycanilyticus TaxID=126569 RepID=A0ABQ6GAJ9_9BACL|nr:AraC family transcriptional regulator [Paenibacillus glycanilyticus]GLX67060.1 hypothetical protein MU1_14040 [Paenibacillus glycanilyticus]